MLNDKFLMAAGFGELESMKYLLSQGADVNVIDPDSNRNALFSAAWRGHEECVHWLIEQGADIHQLDTNHQSILSIACFFSDKCLSVINRLIEIGLDINHQDKNGMTPLMLAILSSTSSVEFIHYLIEQGADASLKNIDGRAALDIAVNAGRHDIVRYFTDKNDLCDLIQKIAYNVPNTNYDELIF